jgi:hypothetical protein
MICAMLAVELLFSLGVGALFVLVAIYKVSLFLYGGGIVALCVFILGGAAAYLRYRRKEKTFSLTLGIAAAAMTPQALFIMIFNAAAADGVEPSTYSLVLRTYETVILWLDTRVLPIFSPPFYVTAALAAGLIAIATYARRLEPMRALAKYRKVLGNIGIALSAATTFTAFTAIPVGAWSTDLPRRLEAQIRDTARQQVQANLALALKQELTAVKKSNSPPAAFTSNLQTMSEMVRADHADASTVGANEFAKDLAQAAVNGKADGQTSIPSLSNDLSPRPEAKVARIHSARFEDILSSNRDADDAKEIAEEARGDAKDVLASLILAAVPNFGFELAKSFSEDLANHLVEIASNRILPQLTLNRRTQLADSRFVRQSKPFTRSVLRVLLMGDAVAEIGRDSVKNVTNAVSDKDRQDSIADIKAAQDARKQEIDRLRDHPIER